MRKTQKYSNPRQTMSYSEMVAIWHRMLAAQARKDEQKADLIKQAEKLEQVKQVLSRIYTKVGALLNKIQSILPQPINNLLNAIGAKIMQPILNIIQSFPEAVKNFSNFMQNIKSQLFIAAEKLASVFGEIKNFIQKSVSESFKRFTKKVYKLLNIFGLNSDDDFEEDEKISAEIYAFKAKDIKNLKELLFRLINREKKEQDVLPK